MRPLGKVKIEWSPEFAYAIGLLVTDGCLYSDGRHISLTSKDIEMIETFKKCLGLGNVIGRKASGSTKEKKYFHLQFGDVIFYDFLMSIGLTPRKSKTISKIELPDEYFFDFLRGCFDGDGTFYSYWDPRWRSSYMFYFSICSASEKFILWLQDQIIRFSGVKGHISKSPVKINYQLRFAKADSLKILPRLYYSQPLACLMRKRLKIQRALSIINQSL